MSLRHQPSGKELYRLLPEEYRFRDRDNGDLEAYLGGFGHLLDLFANSLRQRHADSFPEPLDEDNGPQDWILPYLADLVAARLLSPFPEGRREEVAKAIRWRQRKGTLTVVEELAEAVAQKEAETQEGWQRVAVTPRLDTPLMPASALGFETHPLDLDPDAGGPASVLDVEPLVAADHPGLETATLDFRLVSRAVAAEPGTAGSQRSSFFTGEQSWRQLNPRGLPCFPGTFEDASKRTADIRTPPTWKHGHFHPKRLILFLAPPYGLFQPDPLVFADLAAALAAEAITLDEDDFDVVAARTADQAVVVEDDLLLDDGKRHDYAGILFTGKITVANDSRLKLSDGALHSLEVTVADQETPVVELKSAIVETIAAASALLQMEYVTLRGKTEVGRLQASEAIFVSDDVQILGTGAPRSCIRYSRIPANIGALPSADLSQWKNTTDRPIFYPFLFKAGSGFEVRPAEFGEPGCALLHLATPQTILAGAEDEGEMGALHEFMASAAIRALLEKLKDYLPIGLEAVALYDRRLLQAPPTIGSGA